MKRPTIVWSFEVALLDGPSVRDRVVFDVTDGSTNFIRMINEDLPPAVNPHGMIERAKTISAKPQAAVMLQVLDHLLRLMPKFPDDQVHMIAKDRTRVARVFESLDGVRKSARNTDDRVLIQLKERMLQDASCGAVKGPNVTRCWLDPLPS